MLDVVVFGAFFGEVGHLLFYDAGVDAVVARWQPALRGLRRWRIPRFTNHLIFSRVTDEGLEIVRVLHGARDIKRILEHAT